jgi:Holliday junction resolvase RusA-like endonuclease
VTLRITVPGVPVPWGRSGLRVVAGHAQSYTPAKTRSHEAWVRLHAIEAMAGKPGFPIDGPVGMTLTFYLTRPPSRRKRDLYPDRKPDLDNLTKAVLDGLEKAGVFTNDSRIVGCASRKVYGEPPRTEIEVEEME